MVVMYHRNVVTASSSTVERKVPEFRAVCFGPIQVNLSNLSSKILDPRERNSRQGVKSIVK